MINVVEVLNAKRSGLFNRKREICEEAKRVIAEIDKEIADLDKAIDLVLKALDNVICPYCKGEGTIRKCDAAGQFESVQCSDCAGTGVKIN